MKNILIVRTDGKPFAIRMSKFIYILQKHGFHCTILVPENYDKKLNVGEEMGWINDHRIIIITYSNPNTSFHKLRQKLLCNFFGNKSLTKTLYKLVSENEYQAIFVKDSQPLGRVFKAISLSKRQYVPVICDLYENVREQQYDNYFRYSKIKHKSLALAFFHHPRIYINEKKYLPRCTHIFVVVEEMKYYLQHTYYLPDEKIHVVHNSEILSSFDTIEAAKPQDFILASYVGGIAPNRGVEIALEAIAQLKQEYRNRFRFVVVGAKKTLKSVLDRECKALGIYDIVQIYDFLPHKEALSWIKRSHIGIIPYMNTGFIRTTIPNKLFQYMAASAACIVSDTGPLKRIVEESNCGICFKAGCSKDLAEKLMLLLSDRSVLMQKALNGRRAIEHKYNWEAESSAYLSVLHRIMNG